MLPVFESDAQPGSVAFASAEPSDFSWYELHTPDVASAAAFYGSVLGWTMLDAGVPERKYTIVSVGDTPVGGLLEKPASGFASGEKPRWIGYIGVDDIHLIATRVQAAGGIIHRAAEEIPGVGTFAVAADPQGATFMLFQPPAGAKPPEKPSMNTPGLPVWHDLRASDWEPEFEFYAGLFCWTKADAVNIGPTSVYQIFAAGSKALGGMMTDPEAAQGASWIFYFQVDEVEAAIDRVRHNGGTLIHGPTQVPGGLKMAHCLDTQGAIFGMVGSGRQ